MLVQGNDDFLHVAQDEVELRVDVEGVCGEMWGESGFFASWSPVRLLPSLVFKYIILILIRIRMRTYITLFSSTLNHDTIRFWNNYFHFIVILLKHNSFSLFKEASLDASPPTHHCSSVPGHAPHLRCSCTHPPSRPWATCPGTRGTSRASCGAGRARPATSPRPGGLPPAAWTSARSHCRTSCGETDQVLMCVVQDIELRRLIGLVY